MLHFLPKAISSGQYNYYVAELAFYWSLMFSQFIDIKRKVSQQRLSRHYCSASQSHLFYQNGFYIPFISLSRQCVCRLNFHTISCYQYIRICLFYSFIHYVLRQNRLNIRCCCTTKVYNAFYSYVYIASLPVIPVFTLGLSVGVVTSNLDVQERAARVCLKLHLVVL